MSLMGASAIYPFTLTLRGRATFPRNNACNVYSVWGLFVTPRARGVIKQRVLTRAK